MSRYLSRADLEHMAGTLVSQYYQAVPPADELPQPVDPVKLAQTVMGLEVNYLPLSSDGSVLGVACFRETELQVSDATGKTLHVVLTAQDIVLDESLNCETQIGRHNFTAAHELSHHLLVRRFPEDYRELLNCRTHFLYRFRSQTRNWVEWQADTLGAAVLMPGDTLRACMEVFGLRNRLDMLSSVCRPTEYKVFCKIAAHLGVSKKALAIRMKQLGLLGEEYLANPTAPIDVWRDDDNNF